MVEIFSEKNSEVLDERSVPLLPNNTYFAWLDRAIVSGKRVSAYFGSPLDQDGGSVRLYAILADDTSASLTILATDVSHSFTSLTPTHAQFHLFEREIYEQFGMRPEGHPWLKPVRFTPPWVNSDRHTSTPTIGQTDYFSIGGEDIHEVAVGPVHAGVIEPGHFRFQCYGEEVQHLEISLGYQHRGIEKQLVGGPHKRTLVQLETAAGDTTIAHCTAYCQIVEALSGLEVSDRAKSIRAILLELERVANHVGDLGALAQDVGYLPSAAYCGRLRGDFLNLTTRICGSRLGRSAVVPGGVRFDIDETFASSLLTDLDLAQTDFESAVELLFNRASVLDRFELTGAIAAKDCVALGLVGPAARACGVTRDVRANFPFGRFQTHPIESVTASSGDVFARALVRWKEVESSIEYIRRELSALPSGPIRSSFEKDYSLSFSKSKIVTALTEGWRGEVCHVAITDSNGKFLRYKIVDPSFHNWTGLAIAMRNQQISDFPLCNKSFNLSYCGVDL